MKMTKITGTGDQRGETTVLAEMSFLQPWSNSEPPYLRNVTSSSYPPTNFENELHTVTITDARTRKSEFSLDEHGFAFREAEPLADDVVDAIRSGARGKNVVEEKVFPDIEELMKVWTGAKKVLVFDYGYRKRDPNIVLNGGQNPYARGQPATVVHCDQSAWGARRRVEKYTGDNAHELLRSRCQIINVWRPLVVPVHDWPLAFMDASTLSKSHTHPTNLYSESLKLQGQTVNITYDEGQRWYFLGGQEPKEVTLLKIWDSAAEDGKDIARLCAHCAFQHPGAGQAVAPRESIELRCLVFY